MPAFLDFPAEYAGQTTVDGSPAHLLRVELPLGGVAIYAIDTRTYLPVRVDLPDWDLQQRFGDYRDVGGVLYPHRIWNAADPSRFAIVTNLMVNVELEPDRFVLPATIH